MCKSPMVLCAVVPKMLSRYSHMFHSAVDELASIPVESSTCCQADSITKLGSQLIVIAHVVSDIFLRHALWLGDESVGSFQGLRNCFHVGPRTGRGIYGFVFLWP